MRERLPLFANAVHAGDRRYCRGHLEEETPTTDRRLLPLWSHLVPPRAGAAGSMISSQQFAFSRMHCRLGGTGLLKMVN